MNLFFKTLIGNLLLKKGPQDFPYSNVLMRLSLIVYFVTGLPGLLRGVTFEVAVLAMALDVVILLLFVYLCLQAFSKSARYTQAVTALASVGVIFELVILPLLNNLGADTAEGKAAVTALVLIGLYSWFLAVYTHIFRESFGVRLPAAMILTICYVLINLFAGQVLLPEIYK